jgi:cytochrome b6-f complex iron-sulfur subunit
VTPSHPIASQDGASPEPRRSFLTALFCWVGLGSGLAATAAALVRFLLPLESAAKTRRVYAGPAEGLEANEPRLISDLQGRPVAVFGPSTKPLALSLICTHLGCRIHWQADQTFLCPCHEGRFSATGVVLSGPPPEPLPRYSVLVEQGAVYVDLPEA